MTQIHFLQRILAIGLPCAALIAPIMHILWFGMSENYLLAGAVLLITSGLLARFLMARSRDQEARFVTVRITADDDDAAKNLTDIASIIGALILLACCVLVAL